jgi:hypothetical protein
MFTVELYAKVRHAVMIEGLSRREAAKRFGIHRNTITKMLSFTDPQRGASVSALEGKEGLLIDPTVKETKDAFKTAFFRAAKDEATLSSPLSATARNRARTIILCPRMRLLGGSRFPNDIHRMTSALTLPFSTDFGNASSGHRASILR